MKMSDNNTIKICLTGASFDTPNLGVSALAESSIKCIAHRWPNAEILILGSTDSDKQRFIKTQHKQVKLSGISVKFSKNIFLPNHFLRLMFYLCLLRILQFKSVRQYLMNRNQTLRLILQSHFFADITGGDSFSDIYGIRRFMWCLLPKLLPLAAGKELILLPQTYGPFKSRFSKYLARYILSRSKIINSRDRAGADHVREILNGAVSQVKVRVIPDVAFVLDSRKPSLMDVGTLMEVRREESIVVGINISGLLYYGGYTGDNMFGLREDYKQVLIHIIEFFIKKSNVLLLLVPHIFPPVGLIDKEIVENDVTACLDLYNQFSNQYAGRIFMVRGTYDQGEIKYIIGLCQFFLGSRMHSCIAALSQEIPAVGLAYSKKFAGVFDLVGVSGLVIDLRDKTKKKVEELISNAFEQRDVYRRILSEKIPLAKQEVLSVFDAVAKEKNQKCR